MAEKRNAPSLSVLLFREDDVWIAQCLEHDICVQASSKDEIRHELERVITAQFLFSNERGKPLFDGLPPAPASFWERYKHAARAEDFPIRLDASGKDLDQSPTLVPAVRIDRNARHEQPA
jgi:hypothetical protein